MPLIQSRKVGRTSSRSSEPPATLSMSMEKTLLIGDHVMVDRTTLAPRTAWAPFVHYRNPQRGDIIVFFKPNPESPHLVLVKRCIGVPGDHIHLIHGIVYLNGGGAESAVRASGRRRRRPE